MRCSCCDLTVFTLFLLFVHVAFMLYSCCIHFVFMLCSCCVSVFYVEYMDVHVVYILYSCCVHVVYVVRSCCVRVVYMLCSMLYSCCWERVDLLLRSTELHIKIGDYFTRRN